MLTLKIIPEEEWDEEHELFVNPEPFVLRLEHSLVSLSKWESKWKKSFINTEKKTIEESIDYINCMLLDPIDDPSILYTIPQKDLETIFDYIEDPQTATTFKEMQSKGRKEIITAEIIYSWMVALNIPTDKENWHLNKLLTLIKVVSIKNQPQKKMSKQDLYARNRAINKANSARLRR